MTKEIVYLPRYGWKVEFFIDFDCAHIHDVMQSLQNVDCSFDILEEAYFHMRKCEPNTGLTYTNPDYRTSVAVAYVASSAAELFNTVVHECAHVCAHITKNFIIKLTEEEFCEMIGDLASGISKSVVKALESYER